MLSSKQKIKLMIVKKMMNKNFCFFIVSGKQKILSELFGNGSVLHISFFKGILNNNFLFRYAFSFVCIYNFKDFLKYYNILSERHLLIHQICVNNSFLNFYGLMDNDFKNHS
jgi:hypothetical protein